MNSPRCGSKLPAHRPHQHSIFSSAPLLKNLAFTMASCFGSFPSPRTLQEPDHSTSVMGAAPFVLLAAFTRVCSLTRVHSLPRSTVGQKLWFLFKWSCLIPTFPKCPGGYLPKLILWWCKPPPLPRPGCFLCLRTGSPGPEVFRSSSVWMSCWWPKCKRR